MPTHSPDRKVVTRFCVHSIRLNGDVATVRPCPSSLHEVTLRGVVPVPQGKTDEVAFQISPTGKEKWYALTPYAGELVEVIGTAA